MSARFSFLPSFIRVTKGEGTADKPWRLTAAALREAISHLDYNRKTVYFPAGIYEAYEPIEINFGDIFPPSVPAGSDIQEDADFKRLREGVRFLGEGRASVIRHAGEPLDTDIFFHVHWTADRGTIRQAPLFFWEFSGLHFQGNSRTALVQFGGNTVEDCAFNSCVFDLAVNNANQHPTAPARGIVLKRVLQSRIELVATCHRGTACVMECCEFNTINGSFSNGEVKDESTESGYSIAPDSIALHLLNCCANGSTSINIEVAYEGIRLEGFTGGNTFGSVVSNNCDERGCVIDDDTVEAGMENVIQCIVRRDVRQRKNAWQQLFCPHSHGSVTVKHDTTVSIEAGLAGLLQLHTGAKSKELAERVADSERQGHAHKSRG